MVAVYDDSEALSRAVAKLFAEEARRAVKARGRFTVLLSGGETPRRSYQLLAREPLRSSIPWQAVHLFWGDERWVPQDDPRSNLGMARRAFIDQVALSDTQVHPVPFESSPHESALRYERMLRSFFDMAPPRFDLVLLGLGQDGHTASLFPESPALDEWSRWVCEVYVAEQDLYRVTTTAPLINQAALVAFVVAGPEKAAVLRRVLEGAQDPKRTPAQLIKPEQGRLLWLADREATRLLPEKRLRPDPDLGAGPSD
jgi:6-phosphogluconolactonase